LVSSKRIDAFADDVPGSFWLGGVYIQLAVAFDLVDVLLRLGL
jgi:hypothetical protein